DVTLDMTNNGPPMSASFTVTFHGPKNDVDVTQQSEYVLQDPTLGVMNGNVFTTGTDHGGSTTPVINYPAPTRPLSTQANIHVKVHGTFQGPDCAPNCPPFPGDGAAPCGPGVNATIIYPADGVLLPPNLNSGFEIHFMEAPGATLYELDFNNPA